MNVEIRVDAPQALPTIASVEAALAKVEAKGPAVGDAISKGLGNSSTAAEKTKQSTTSLTDQMAKLANSGAAFAGIADHFKRQAEMLERVRGPVREYDADLRALDEMLQRNTISTKEYAEQVTILNRKIGERPSSGGSAEEGGGIKIEGNLGSSLAGQFGEAGSMLAKLAQGGAIEAAALVGLTVEVLHLGDEYIALSNKAMKFVNSTHDINTVMADQFTLSKELHGSMEQSMEVYQQVREGTDELNLSYEQQIRLAKSVSEAVELSGRPLGDASVLMQRLSYAFASNTLNGRELKGMMREFPDVAEVWTTSLGHTRKELVAMANAGTLSARDLMDAFAKAGPELDEKFGNRVETLGQSFQHFKDGLVLTIGKIAESTGIFKVLGEMLSKVGDFIGAVVGTIGKIIQFSGVLQILAVGFKVLGGIMSVVTTVIKGIGDVIGTVTSAIGSVVDSVADAWHSLTGEVEHASATELLAIARGRAMIGMLNDQQGAFEWMHASQDTAQKFYDTLVNLPKEIGDITKAFGDLGRSIGVVGDQWDTSLGAFGRMSKLVMDNSAKIGDAKLQLVALQAAMKAGGPAGDDARKQYEALVTTINNGHLPATIKVFNSLHDAIRAHNEELAATNELYKSNQISARDYQYELIQLQNTDPGFARLKAILDDNVKKYDEAAAAAKRYREAAEHGFASPAAAGLDGSLFRDANRQALIDYRSSQESDKVEEGKLGANEKEYLRVITMIESPLQKYRDEIAKLGEDYQKGALDADTYAKALHKLTTEQYAAFETRSVDAISGVDKGLKSLRDSTLDIGKTMTESITGAFAKMNDAIVAMVTTGKADFGQLASFIEQALAKIALQEIEIGLISTFAPGGAAAGTAVAKIAGSWSGSDTAIPHAANGYAGRVGGVGGTDTKLFAAMVTPGETVQIRTPEQMAAQQRGSGSQPVTIVNKHDTRGELASGLSSGDFDTHVINLLKRNSGAVQSLLRK